MPRIAPSLIENVFALQEFFKEHKVPCPRAVCQALESIANNVAIVKRDMDPVSDWLLEFADRMQLVDLRICDGGAA